MGAVRPLRVPFPPKALTGAALGAAFLVFAACCGALVGWQPRAAPALVAALALPLALKAVAASSVPRAAIASLVFLHGFALVRRWEWLDEHARWVGYLRLPLQVAMAAALLVTGYAALLRHPGRHGAVHAVVFAGWALLAAFWTADPGLSAFYAAWLLLIVINCAMTIAVQPSSEASWDGFLRGVVGIGVVMCAISLGMVALGVETARADRWVGLDLLVGYEGPFTSPNVMGGQACMMTAAALALQVRRGGRAPPWLVPVVLLGTITVFASASRGCLLAWGLGLGGYAALVLRERGLSGRALLGLAGFVLISAAVLVGTEFGGTAIARWVGTGSEVSAGREARVAVWKSTFGLLREHPLVGVGMMNTPMRYDPLNVRWTGEPKSAHSVLLLYGLWLGVPGTLLMGTLGGRALMRIWGLRRSRLAQSWVVMMLGVLPPYFAEATAEPGHYGAELWWFLILFAAMLPRVRAS
jgi:O-antigen ligase